MIAVPERVNPFFGAGLLLITAGTTENSVKTVRTQTLLQGFGLHDVGVFLAAVGKRTNTGRKSFLVGVDDEVAAPSLSRARRNATTSRLHLAFGEKKPWYRMALTRGRGVIVDSLAISAIGVRSCAHLCTSVG